MGSIYERLDVRSNSLNFLRLLLAGLVIVSHAAPISGLSDEWRIGGISLGNIAVGGFFAISGYLITASRFSSPIAPYAWRRFLRIFPGYWACLAVVGLVFGALAGAVRGGWTLQSGLGYLASNASMVRGGDAFTATLQGAPFPAAWNGSLWTLRYELLCYVAVGAALLIPRVFTKAFVFPLVFVLVSVASIPVHMSGIGGSVRDIAFLVPFFAAGACLFRFSKWMPMNGKYALGAVALLLAVVSLGLGHSLAALPLAYLCLWAGIALPDRFRRIGKKNDVSYGVYLYGFPVQQMLVLIGAHHLGLPLFILLSLVAVLPVAAASWFLVERPAMSLKGLVGKKMAPVSA